VAFDHAQEFIEHLAVNMLAVDVPGKTVIIDDIEGFATDKRRVNRSVALINHEACEQGLLCHNSLPEWPTQTVVPLYTTGRPPA
jgi:hypothetical protein